MNKKIVISSAITVTVICGALFLLLNNGNEPEIIKTPIPKSAVPDKASEAASKLLNTEPQYKKPEKTETINYSDKLPLNSMILISEMNKNEEKAFKSVLENSSEIYFIKKQPETSSYIILAEMFSDSDKKFARHNLKFAEISKDGAIEYTPVGFSGEFGEVESFAENPSEEWIFDENSDIKRPLSHVVFGDKNEIIYTEKWNYGENEPIKYEMKNSEGKVVSMLKKTTDGGMNLRKEHLFYDESGSTQLSISAGYEGNEIKTFNYYNASVPDESIMVESTFSGGEKTVEKTYDVNLNEINTVKVEHITGNPAQVRIYDSKGKEIKVTKNKDN